MSRPSVIITRPEQDALPLAHELENLGYDVHIEPVLRIETREKARVELLELLDKPLQAVLVSSKHAIAALKELSGIRDYRLITIGHSTYVAALHHGFTHVEAAEGDAVSLMDYVREHCTTAGGPLLYAAGRDITASIDEILGAEGYQVNKVTVYTAHASDHIAQDTVQALKQKSIKAVLLFSHRSADIFLKLAAENNVTASLQHAHALCLSEAITKSLSKDQWKSVRSAPSHTAASMITLLRQVVEV